MPDRNEVTVTGLAAAWEAEAATLDRAAAGCAPGDPSKGETAQATAYRNEAKIYRRNATALRELAPHWDAPRKQLADLRMSLDYCAGQWESNAMPHTMPPRQPWQRAIYADCARDLRYALKANAPDAASVRAELATLRALRAVASGFAATWAELLWSLPDSYECHMNCAEANAVADLFRALGRDIDADAIIAAHIEHDDEDERETHNDEAPATEALCQVPEQCGNGPGPHPFTPVRDDPLPRPCCRQPSEMVIVPAVRASGADVIAFDMDHGDEGPVLEADDDD